MDDLVRFDPIGQFAEVLGKSRMVRLTADEVPEVAIAPNPIVGSYAGRG